MKLIIVSSRDCPNETLQTGRIATAVQDISQTLQTTSIGGIGEISIRRDGKFSAAANNEYFLVSPAEEKYSDYCLVFSSAAQKDAAAGGRLWPAPCVARER